VTLSVNRICGIYATFLEVIFLQNELPLPPPPLIIIKPKQYDRRANTVIGMTTEINEPPQLRISNLERQANTFY
jgi:hypothetical protein